MEMPPSFIGRAVETSHPMRHQSGFVNFVRDRVVQWMRKCETEDYDRSFIGQKEASVYKNVFISVIGVSRFTTYCLVSVSHFTGPGIIFSPFPSRSSRPALPLAQFPCPHRVLFPHLPSPPWIVARVTGTKRVRP